MKTTARILILLLFFISQQVLPAHAQSGVQVISDSAAPAFPESLLFTAEFRSGVNITSVVLEYGVNQLTCGSVIAKAFPDITPGQDVKAEWTWEMRQSGLTNGSLPPGATIWWQWVIMDANGSQTTTPTKNVTWLDSIHSWQEISGGDINLYYYDGKSSFGQELHDAATQALTRLSKEVGVTTSQAVDIYIYANATDMQAAVLYAPTWTGGEAFPEFNSVIIGIAPSDLDWGKSTEAHELTHVLVGHLTFSCLGFVPQWLNEGLAMYGEGGVQAAEQAQFDQAKAAGQLLSLSSLTGNFSAESSRASLSYTEAYSVVNFMVKSYGRDKMTALLLDLRNGDTIDEALQAEYGFDQDGLERAWRTSIGASLPAEAVQATPQPTPTQVPTIVPIGASNPISTSLPSTLLTPTPSPGAPPEPISTITPAGSGSSILNRVIIYSLICLGAILIVAAIVILIIVRRRNRS